MRRVHDRYTGFGVHIRPLQIVVVRLDLSEDQTLSDRVQPLCWRMGFWAGSFSPLQSGSTHQEPTTYSNF